MTIWTIIGLVGAIMGIILPCWMIARRMYNKGMEEGIRKFKQNILNQLKTDHVVIITTDGKPELYTKESEREFIRQKDDILTAILPERSFYEDKALKAREYDAQYDVTLLKNGSRIHVHSVRGIYEVISFVKNASITISCRKWEEMFHTNEIGSPVKTVGWSDFKCFEGKKKDDVPQPKRLYSGGVRKTPRTS